MIVESTMLTFVYGGLQHRACPGPGIKSGSGTSGLLVVWSIGGLVWSQRMIGQFETVGEVHSHLNRNGIARLWTWVYVWGCGCTLTCAVDFFVSL